ncbi:MAG: DUF4296 domain-containing protein [Alistipes sp.]|jgi:hypothetical protein|nr:DUF4296 domain-containing protein [Alistipes sp.]
MKRVIICILIVLSVAGCARKKEIDDHTLAKIFSEAYITNAYMGIKYFNIDSVQIYEPILEHYGFTPEDFRYTIGNFSRRKSAQLGRVLKEAEEQIKQYADIYDREVVILDTIQNVAVRTMQRVVHKDSLISIKKLADSSKLKMVIDPLQPGMYSVRYKYNCTKEQVKDKKGKKKDLALRGVINIETSTGTHANNYAYNLREEENIRRTISTDTAAKRLVITFAKPADPTHKMRKPNITISDFIIEYTPEENLAIDSLFKRYIDIKIFDDVFFSAKDSLALSADTTRVL